MAIIRHTQVLPRFGDELSRVRFDRERSAGRQLRIVRHKEPVRSIRLRRSRERFQGSAEFSCRDQLAIQQRPFWQAPRGIGSVVGIELPQSNHEWPRRFGPVISLLPGRGDFSDRCNFANQEESKADQQAMDHQETDVCIIHFVTAAGVIRLIQGLFGCLELRFWPTIFKQ